MPRVIVGKKKGNSLLTQSWHWSTDEAVVGSLLFHSLSWTWKGTQQDLCWVTSRGRVCFRVLSGTLSTCGALCQTVYPRCTGPSHHGPPWSPFSLQRVLRTSVWCSQCNCLPQTDGRVPMSSATAYPNWWTCAGVFAQSLSFLCVPFWPPFHRCCWWPLREMLGWIKLFT